MATPILGRMAVRGGYGALMRKQVVSSQWGATRAFSISTRMQEKFYTEDHEWIEYSADKKSATFGVSEFAARQLGDVVYVELPKEGTEVKPAETLGAIESVKSASEIYSPITGKVSQSNSLLEEEPSLINKDAEGEAWIARFDVTGADTGKLLTAEEYKKITEE